jgi:hypothetical protein
MPPSASEVILRSINVVLEGRFHVHHSTVQFEHVRCEHADENCTAPLHSGGRKEVHR